MDFQQIKMFISVSRHLNFTRAAEEFYTTQPTVSRQINLLEEEWGFPLFLRNKKEVRLTPEGLIMLEKCNIIENVLKDGLEEIRDFRSGRKGNLRIGCLEAMDTSLFISPTASFFNREYPGVSISIERRSFAELREKLENGYYDIIFTLDFELQNLKDVLYEAYYPVKTAFVLSRKHPLAGRENLCFQDLEGQTFILPEPTDSPGREQELKKILTRIGIQESKILYVPNQDSMILNTRAGKGISLLDTSVKSLYEEEYFIYLTIEPEIAPLSVLCVWKKENLNPVIPLYTETLMKNEYIDVFYN